MSITVRHITVTPAMAAKWLDRNEGNRNLRRPTVAKYAADMLADRWQQNGDTFKFDTTGRLIDGQHRCAAVIESGIELPAFIVEGLPAAAAQTLDAGARRSPADALFFAGELSQHTKDIAAGLNAWNAWQAGALSTCHSQPGGSAKLTNAAMVEAWAANPQIVKTAIEAKSIYQRGLRVPAGALTVALVELRALDFDVANDFFDRILDLRTTGKGDPVHTFLMRLQDETSAGRRLMPAKALFMLFRAWNAHVKNEKLSRYQFGSSDSGWATIPQPRRVPASFRRDDIALAVAS